MHSPSPWKLRKAFSTRPTRGAVFDADDKLVAHVVGVSNGGRNHFSSPEYPFNRELIKRAPELLSRLEQLADILSNVDHRDFFERERRKVRKRAVREAQILVRRIGRAK